MTEDVHIFTPESLKRYLKGDISEKEKQAVVMALREDLFLSDAMEGLQNMKDPEKLAEYTPVIKLNRFTTIHKENRSGWVEVALLQYVVALLLLIITWFAFWVICNTHSPKSDVSKKTYIVPSGDSSPNDTIRYFHLSPDIGK